MYTVRLCFYGELNDFIGPERRGTQYERRFPQARSVKDLIESEGVPHPEIDRILVNGKPRMLSARVADGDCICVYPTARTAAGYIGKVRTGICSMHLSSASRQGWHARLYNNQFISS
jgi:hypothetical protein